MLQLLGCLSEALTCWLLWFGCCTLNFEHMCVVQLHPHPPSKNTKETHTHTCTPQLLAQNQPAVALSAGGILRKPPRPLVEVLLHLNVRDAFFALPAACRTLHRAYGREAPGVGQIWCEQPAPCLKPKGGDHTHEKETSGLGERYVKPTRCAGGPLKRTRGTAR